MEHTKNNACRILGIALISWFGLGAMQAWSEPESAFAPKFYAFSNGLKFDTAEQGVRLLKDLGYQGVGSVDSKKLAEFKVACDKEGLKVFSVYLGGKVNEEDFHYGEDVNEAIRLLKGSDALLELNVQRGKDPNDVQAIAMVKEIAVKAKAAGLKLVIYPHDKFHIARVDHAVKIAKATGCDNVGIAFNLCHFLKVQANDDISATLTEAKPLLWSVSINGADADGKDWNTLIRPLDAGTFDPSILLRKLHEMHFGAAIGLQCYNIRIDPKENLTRSMHAWQKHLAAIQKNVSTRQQPSQPNP
jgi:sugar phosphate isomerase/epimerase